MRKFAFVAVLLQLIGFTAMCQDDFDKMAQEFEKKMQGDSLHPYGHNKAVGKYYDIRGFRMYCEVYGQGQPLLIIHGNGGSINNFLYQIPYFSTKYKVIIADSRAQGNSADPGDSLSYEMMADDYSALLDALKVDSANVIGWSDGGINGLLLAIRHPEKVKKLAVTGANLWPDTSAVFQEVINMVKPEYTMLKNKTSRNAQEKSGWKLVRLLLDEPHIPLKDVQNIKCPTMVIGGDHDVIRPEHTMLIAHNIPRSYLWILPNSGHSTPIVYKDEFNKKVDAFFSSSYRKIAGGGRFF
jgi:pimeloyl-ACP methyl ester carboxylesterase